MIELLSDSGLLSGAVGAVAGLGGAVWKYRKKIGKARQSYVEIRQAIEKMDLVTEEWERVNRDGKVTPEEYERMFVQVGAFTREAMEAKLALGELFGDVSR